MPSPIDIDNTLVKIARKYSVHPPFLWDERNEQFVESICSYFRQNNRVSEKQLAALQKISKNIMQNGRQELPKPRAEPDRPGFLGLNCKTGEVNWYSWQEFARD